jgi:sugar phosphate isomerase/epimerase
MKFAICNEIFQGWAPDRIFRFARQAGYHSVEIAPFTLGKPVAEITASERLALRAAAEREGAGVSGLHWVLARTEGLGLTHRDPETRRRTSNYLGELVRLCDDLGGKFIVVGSPKQRDLADGMSRREGLEHALEVFAAPLRLASERGIVFCIEPLAPIETNFINTAREAVQFAEAANSPAMKIILDVKAMSSEGRPIPEIIAESAPWIGYFHANDPNMKGPGFGQTDFRPILDALQRANYDGFVSVEVFNFDEGPEAIATRSIEYLRRCLPSAA